MEYKYQTLVVGGTFDRLHAGHMALLAHAFSLSKHVYVTITSDTYTKKHKPTAAPFRERKKQVEAFLAKKQLLSRATIVPIDDVYGITSGDIVLDALLVTADTKKGAEEVNAKRKALGLPQLVIEHMDEIKSETGLPISSSYIRKGIVTKEGDLAIKHDLLAHVSRMPEILRNELQQPFGTILPQEQLSTIQGKNVIAVGDVTTRVLHEHGITPIVSIIDFVVERQKQPHNLSTLGLTGNETMYHIVNPPSTLTPALWQTLTSSLEKAKKNETSVIIIEGEEDLAVLPALLLAPFSFIICYGQPHEGMVTIQVERKAKEKALTILSEFLVEY